MQRAGWLAVSVAALHMLVNLVTPFEAHRDEFLYLAMGDHLRWWRMDFPPFIALAGNAQRALMGDALWAIRLLPALVAGLLVWSAAAAARLFGDDESPPSRQSPVLAAIAAASAPVLLRAGSLFQPVVFDQLWWTLSLLALAMRVRRDDGRWWLAVGAALGLGLLTKFSIAFIGVGIAAGVLLSPYRRDVLTRWPWIAVVLALAIGAPSITGQLLLDWPVRGQLRELAAGQLERRSLFAFLAEQPMLVGPVAFALAMWGLVALLRHRRWRAIGVAVVVSWGWLSVQRGKAYYGAPVYPVLFGAGAVALETVRVRRRSGVATWLGPVGAVLMAGVGVVALPIAVPVLSPPATASYATRLGIGAATATNYGTQLALPQDFADMLGWRAQAEAVAAEWAALTPAERNVAVLGANSYGHAGLLDYYGPRLGLPPAVSGAGSYWYFGPGSRRGDVVIMLGEAPGALTGAWARCRLLRTVENAWGVEEERVVPITRCDGPREPLPVMWPRFAPYR